MVAGLQNIEQVAAGNVRYRVHPLRFDVVRKEDSRVPKTWIIFPLISVTLLLVSFHAALFGPRHQMLWGAVAFVFIIVFFAILKSDLWKDYFGGIPEYGALGHRKDFPKTSELLRIFTKTAGFIAVFAGVSLFAFARLDGVSNLPVFEPQARFFLTNHGDKTEVSHLRYIAVGLSFTIGWHFLPIAFCGHILQKILFADFDAFEKEL